MNEIEIPSDLDYTEDHEWVQKISDEKGCVYIGLTHYAQDSLGDIVYLEIEHSVGDIVEMGDVLGVVEAVKTVSDIYMPISGKILEINKELEDNPQNINDEPYEEGWIIKVKISDEKEFDSLMTANEYYDHILSND